MMLVETKLMVKVKLNRLYTGTNSKTIISVKYVIVVSFVCDERLERSRSLDLWEIGISSKKGINSSKNIIRIVPKLCTV